ncbi:hypothetical protein bthur0009_33860 [Bacillus thuringiensis serovar andalousiensis BGSC 4AW1]|nr:hypothetical protein B7P25_18745 [Bacillus thuringiensis]EEM70633.1 hypothetical protein bthur0009_33860 [Bacillus thuringiensis serovar andalousiensis BGSC 4AW1]TNO98849.1 hypothetical protein FH038_06050 [Bacillus sp. CD3-1a]
MELLAFVQTYTKTDSLFMVHTGNTVGMRGITTATAYQYNALITRDTNLSFAGVPSSVDPLTFAGTTNDWTLNGSWARLNPSVTDVPATATVDFAMLVWQGTLSATVTETVVNNNIPTLQTPDGVTHTITSVPAWGETRSSGTFQGTIYTRAANVTNILQGLSNRAAGDYFVERVPTANPPTQGTGVGWALVVVYRDNSYPIRNVSLYTGLLISTLGETATISNFITPAVAPVNARVFTMAINGDTDATGDRFNLNGTGLSGPNNLINNFFASQVNNYLGNLNTVGSFGDRNMPIGTSATNRRAEFDVTNVPANGVLTAGSTSTTVNIPNTFDYLYAGAVGLQIDLAEARLIATKSVTVS